MFDRSNPPLIVISRISTNILELSDSFQDKTEKGKTDLTQLTLVTTVYWSEGCIRAKKV